MAYKRKRKSTKTSKGWKKFKRNIPRPTKRRRVFAKRVMAVVNRRAETKKQMLNITSNYTIDHNVLHNLLSNVFITKVGTAGDNIGVGAGGNCRIGNKIFVKGIKVSINLEAQQYRPYTTYVLYLVRNKTDPSQHIDNKDEMFEGVSTTIPCDYVDPTKVHVLFQKRFTLKAPNTGTTVAMSTSADGVLFNGGAYKISGDEDYEVFTNPRYCGKFYVPINKQIKYLDYNDDAAGLTESAYRYQWVITGYNNFSTKTGDNNYPLAHITMTQQVLFTDV